MNSIDLRVRYQDNIKVLEKLRDMLKHDKNNSIIIGSIKKVEAEQNDLCKQLRTSIYKNAPKKLLASMNKKEDIKINKNNDVVYDKSNVVIQDVKEDTHIKVINITGEEDKKNDDITEVLKQDKISKKELEDAKVVFDGSYKLIYANGTKIYEKPINELILDNNIKQNTSAFNDDIKNLLKNFDFENDTNMLDKYMKNELYVLYDFDKAKKVEKSKLKKVKKIAKREYDLFGHVKINRARNYKYKKFLATAVLATTAIGALLGSTFKQNKNYTNQKQAVTAGQTDAIKEEVQFIEETTPVEVEDKESKTKEETIEVKEIKEIKEEENVTETEEQTESIKVGDILTLEDADLYYASTDEVPRGNTSHLGEARYRVGVISVVYNNQVMELVYNDKIDLNELEKICKEKYGDDVKISVNLDQLDTNDNEVTDQVGWTPEEQILSKGKVLTR